MLTVSVIAGTEGVLNNHTFYIHFVFAIIVKKVLLISLSLIFLLKPATFAISMLKIQLFWTYHLVHVGYTLS